MDGAIQDPRTGLPANYDPDKGLKSVAVAEAAEKHFARAKDATKLCEAVEAKLTEQRNFVLWWDGNKHGGAARPGGAQSQFNSSVKLPDSAPDAMTISRWRKRLYEPERFAVALATAAERCVKICEARQHYPKAVYTAENDWHTPSEYLDAARQVLGDIDLDPASSHAAQERVRASSYFTLENDGLVQEWHGRIWLNPPYAQPFLAAFVSKLLLEFQVQRAKAAILLTHNYTDTAWFHEAASEAAAVCFKRHRIKFVNANGEEASPTQGQAFFYFGSDVSAFHDVFSEIGFVVRPL